MQQQPTSSSSYVQCSSNCLSCESPQRKTHGSGSSYGEGFLDEVPYNQSSRSHEIVISFPQTIVDECAYLNYLLDAYRTMSEKMYKIEHDYLRESPKKPIRDPDSGFQLLDAASMGDITRRQLPCFIDFAKCIGHFDHLEEDEKTPMFTEFYLNSLILLWWHNIYKTLRPEQYYKYCPATSSTMVSRARLDVFAGEQPEIKTSLEDFKQIVETWFLPCRWLAATYMRDLKILQEEYVVLMHLCFWNSNVYFVTDNITKLGKIERTRIFHQLHLFYKKNNIKNDYQRLGELMTIFSKVVDENHRSKTESTMFHITDAFLEGNFLYGLFC